MATIVARVPAAAPALLPMKDVVLLLLDGLGRQQMSDFVTARVLIIPCAHRVEHVALDLDVLIAKRGVVEGAKDVVHDLVNGDVGVLPSKEHTPSSISTSISFGGNDTALTGRHIEGS